MDSLTELTNIVFLANVDESILGLDLGEGNSVGFMENQDALKLMAELEGTFNPNSHIGDLFQAGCINNSLRRVYFVKRAMWGASPTALPRTSPVSPGLPDLSLVILADKIRLSRLFHGGNLAQPIFYEYYLDGPRKRWSMKGGSPGPVTFEPFHIAPGELDGLNNYLRGHTLPLSQPYIDLSFRAFESSYISVGLGLQFLAVFSGLEALLNPADHEVRFRLSRNVACLLGGTSDEHRNNIRRVRQLYDKRSAFTHGGDETKISREDVSEARELLRRCILAADVLALSKASLTSNLEERGFSAG